MAGYSTREETSLRWRQIAMDAQRLSLRAMTEVLLSKPVLTYRPEAKAERGVQLSAADAIASLINFSALAFLGAQVMLARQALRETARAQRREWERQRKRSTLETYASGAQYEDKLKSALPWNDRNPEEMAKFFEEAWQDYSKLWPIREYLNYLDCVAVGVKQGVYDLDTVNMMQGGRIIDVAASYAPYIERIRQEIDRSTVYEDLEDLAELIRAQRQDPASIANAEVQRAITVRLYSAMARLLTGAKEHQ